MNPEHQNGFEISGNGVDKRSIALKRKYIALKKSMSRKIRELEDTRREFFRFLENQRDGAMIVDMMGRIIFCNPAAVEIWEYPKDEVLKRHFRMFLTLDDLANGFKLYYNVLKGEYSTNNLFRIRCKNGSTKVVEINAGPLHEFGKVVGALSIIRDISIRKQVERENLPRVEEFKQLDRDLSNWKKQVENLQGEVDTLLVELGRGKKYGK
ncbi:MAG: PAS domain S-box protein [Candidatus Omnitrophica bacterium]|nr:PAS domain S-box protein [Candidatus Omnitrophota bacterium]